MPINEAVLPRGSRRRRAAKAALVGARRLRRRWWGNEDWSRLHQPDPGRLDQQRQVAAKATHAPEVRVFVIGTPAQAEPTLASLAVQSWSRFTSELVPPGAGWVDAVTQALSAASPDGLSLFCAAGDTFSADCIYHVAAAGQRDPLVELIYWDDDAYEGEGRRPSPRIRPSWSPELLLSCNYIGSALAVRNRSLTERGPLVAHADAEAGLWALLLRFRKAAPGRVERLPRVLSHARRRTDLAAEQGWQIVDAYLRSQGPGASATLDAGRIRVHRQLEKPPLVSVILPTRHNRENLTRLFRSLPLTDYPSYDVTVVDSGEQSEENERWYRDNVSNLTTTVTWWSGPFNFSAVNNQAASQAMGEVLLFLNDDTEVIDPAWMREMVSWAMADGVGAVGAHLLAADGTIQHAGAIVGLNGFADHVFEGMQPDEDTIFGRVDCYRNFLAVTAACLAIRRDVFEAAGGFDERFELCGSDVALGLALHRRGLRNVCTPFARLRHLGSATRGTEVPPNDFFTSFWQYQKYLVGGDPYFSPNLALDSKAPRLRFPEDPSATDLASPSLGRKFKAFRQVSDTGEARYLAEFCRLSDIDRARVSFNQHRAATGNVQTVNWFVPGVENPFYGGIATAFRIAQQLQLEGIRNRFVVWDIAPAALFRSALAASFPALAGSEIVMLPDLTDAALSAIPPSDAAIATLWVTAYLMARTPGLGKRFYLVQDFEPMFYPGGTLYALADESYRLGLYGICNTPTLARIYADDYGGTACGFVPAVDRTIFYPPAQPRDQDAPVTVFVYARPGHWRNCWELASLALQELKQRLGSRVRIIAAGSWAIPDDPNEDLSIKHLGQLDYAETGDLYRACDIALTLAVSKHPSYLPLELMASGVPVVAFDNPAASWLLAHEENCLLAQRSVDSVAGALERLAVDVDLRRRLASAAVRRIDENHSDWDGALAGIPAFVRDPLGAAASHL